MRFIVALLIMLSMSTSVFAIGIRGYRDKKQRTIYSVSKGNGGEVIFSYKIYDPTTGDFQGTNTESLKLRDIESVRTQMKSDLDDMDALIVDIKAL